MTAGKIDSALGGKNHNCFQTSAFFQNKAVLQKKIVK